MVGVSFRYLRGIYKCPVLSWNYEFCTAWDLGVGTPMWQLGQCVDKITMEGEEKVWERDTMGQGSKREKPAKTGMARIHRKARRDGCPGNWGGIGPFQTFVSIVPDGQWMSEVVLSPSSQALGLVAGPHMRAAVRWRLLGWKRQTGARLADKVLEPWG